MEQTKPKSSRRWLALTAFFVAGALLTAGVLGLLFNIFERKQEAGANYVRVVEVDNTTVDSAVWGKNFPLQYEGWAATVNMRPDRIVPRTPTAEDPREFTTPSKLEADPRLVTIWRGYAFELDYRKPRGHAWMLKDQELTRRVLERKQPGACLNCHASTFTVMNELGNGDLQAGFLAMNKMPYAEANKLVEGHPVGCIDCHDPDTMELRITRPGFIEGIKELKAGQGIENYDVNTMATAQEMRGFVCAQCHVEYYFAGEEKVLTFPWDYGLKVEDAVKYYDEVGWVDFEHTLTGAKALKAQHPDFETWSQGLHAASGVTCADCHMPYERSGATKISNHQVQSPMLNINATCQTCHKQDEAELKQRVENIHNTYSHTKDRAFDAVVELIADLEKAVKDGAPADRIELAREYQRVSQFYIDYVVSENSEGFHAPQYTMRILADANDYARRGQLALTGQVTEGPKVYEASPEAPKPTP